MKSYQFECVQDVNGKWVPMDEKTPIVTAETPTAAMNSPEIKAFCAEHNCRIFRMVT